MMIISAKIAYFVINLKFVKVIFLIENYYSEENSIIFASWNRFREAHPPKYFNTEVSDDIYRLKCDSLKETTINVRQHSRDVDYAKSTA